MAVFPIVLSSAITAILILVIFYLFRNFPGARTSNARSFEDLKIELAQKDQMIHLLNKEIEDSKQRFQQAEANWLEQNRTERDVVLKLSKDLERITAYSHAQAKQYEVEKKEIERIRQQFTNEFELLANRILEEKSKSFREANTRSLQEILSPFKNNIKTFEQTVEKVYKSESDERNTLKGVIHALVEQTKQIQAEANNLSNALKGNNKKQGNWGEMILERILESSGLQAGREYRIQPTFEDEHGKRLQPDIVIDLPDNKHIIIDSKVSLVAYERWVNSDQEDDKATYIKQHINSIRNHILGLASKNYCDLYNIQSPDFVLLFIPIESSFSLSVTADQEIFNFAWTRRVVLVSPSTLLATLRTVAGLWKQEKQNKNVLEIAREAGLLYDKFVGFVEDMDRMEKQISQLARTQESAKKKLESGRGNLISKIEKLKKLGANTTKNLDSSQFTRET